MKSCLAALLLVGVIDRIEGPFAVVEWDHGGLEDVPLTRIPCPREGAQLHVRARNHSTPDVNLR
ncbi:MAG: DUF3006 domain-containing protein, partial [Proteobacteria bacterium]|nr:DUF3006 domain-containing protein [Pseudomonadota bacterium]